MNEKLLVTNRTMTADRDQRSHFLGPIRCRLQSRATMDPGQHHSSSEILEDGK